MDSLNGTPELIRWGILATGQIAHAFAADLALVPDAKLAAVGSRSVASAEAFAEKYAGMRSHGSYQELADDPQVDVIYIATPHAMHLANVLMCFAAGKHVLCEKPLTLNAKDAAVLQDAAGTAGLFLMEAMWTRCHPNIRRMHEIVQSGRLGTVSYVQADLGFAVQPGAPARLLDPALGASALLDMGIYPLTFARLMLGEPTSMTSAAVLSDQGIDLSWSALATYASGAHAMLSASMTAMMPRMAVVAGDRGRIIVPSDFHHPREFVVTVNGQSETIAEVVIGGAYAHEVIEVHRCLRLGLGESPLVPLDETVSVIAEMDAIRSEIEVTLPGD